MMKGIESRLQKEWGKGRDSWRRLVKNMMMMCLKEKKKMKMMCFRFIIS